MPDETIEMIIHPDGRVEMRIEGVKGDACTKLTEGVERVLGGKVVERELTSEYYAREVKKDPNTQKLGGA